MDLASVVAALASVGVRVSGSTPNSNVQGDSSRACPTGLAGPEPSGTLNDPGQHFQAGTKARRKRAPRQTPQPTPRRGIPRRGGPAPPQPHRTPHDSRGRTPQHTPPKQASDAVRIIPAHTHQPPETTRGMEGTPTRGEQATPTEEAAGNAAAGRTNTPSAPGNDPGRHKGHLKGTGRGRRHGHSDQD